MAGRPNRGTGKSATGLPSGPRPTRGKKLAPGDPNYRPASGYKWEQFKEGNEANLTHGAGSYATGALSRRAEAEAAELVESFLGHGECPEYLTRPVFLPSVRAWARLETQNQRIYQWFESMDYEDQMTPQRPNAQKTPLELWLTIEGKAARARERLGLDPASYARIARDLGLAQQASEDAVSSLAAKGAQIREQREASVVQLRPDGSEGA